MENTAKAIYSKLEAQQPNALDLVLLSLSFDYSDDPVMLLNDWAKSYSDDNELSDLILTAQQSKGLNVTDEYIRPGVYYYSARTSNRVADLVEKDEAIQWITQSLEENYSYIAELVASCVE